MVQAKLAAFADSDSTRHLEDIAAIIRIQGNKLDGAAIDVAAAKLGLLGRWRALWTANQGP